LFICVSRPCACDCSTSVTAQQKIKFIEAKSNTKIDEVKWKIPSGRYK